MNKITIACLIGVFSCVVNAKQKHKHRVDNKGRIVIAVIDTGFNSRYEKSVKICKDGNKSFVNGIKSTEDDHDHGTHIAGLIAKNAKVDYCIMVLKYYSPNRMHDNTIANSNAAFRWAIDHNVDMINYSAGGISYSELEKALIVEALDKGIVIVAAAGNEGKDYKDQPYYPAMYDKRIIVVGNLKKKKDKFVRAPSSNYGEQVDLQVLGTNIRSVNGVMTGTSQSTAIVTGRMAEHIKGFKAIHKHMRK